ncbi:MAG: glycosyltransferase family 39 protein, partial [Prevotellaceae bacterium]|nr:glycosyltransferase family 39 protein [Prevotellaceae bacterium]
MKDSKTLPLPQLLLLSTVLITLFSCCSWIYPLQPHDDANWFMTIGKSMLSDKLLYTNVHDQKGPVIFFLHEWAAALSSRTFLGIYLLEILCCFGFLACSYKTMRMFAGHSICMITACITGVLTYASDFMLYGDTVEELSLPVLSYILYKTLRYAKLGELPCNKESTLIGASIAIVFWMKFTVLSMCVGALTALLILAWRRCQMMPLLQCLTWGIAGAAGLTAGVLLYFVLHGNETDLYHSYFYFNIFHYTDAGKMDASGAWWPLKWAGWALIVGAVLRIRISHDVKLAVAACLATELLTFVLFKVYLYYFLTIYVFAPLLIYFVRDIRPCVVAFGAALLVVAETATNFNLMTLLTGRFPKAVLPLAEIVNADSDPGKGVLTVKSYDTGIYTLTDCLPPVKYFSTPNAYVEELVAEQTACLESCQAKYLIMKTEPPIYYETFHVDLTKDYELLCETEEVRRKEFLLHPLYYLWSLGYMNGLFERICKPERQTISYRLYKRKQTSLVKNTASSLVGEWETSGKDGHCITLSFSKHGLVRCREFASGKQMKDKTYSYSFRQNKLMLGYMFTGETYKTIDVVEHSAARLVLRNWPERGNQVFC